LVGPRPREEGQRGGNGENSKVPMTREHSRTRVQANQKRGKKGVNHFWSSAKKRKNPGMGVERPSMTLEKNQKKGGEKKGERYRTFKQSPWGTVT